MFNVALIGVGNIGLLFDEDKTDTTKVLSHIKALYLHESFLLKYVVDIDDSNLSKVQNFFPEVSFLNDYKNIVNHEDIDIVVIATPTKTHFQILDDFKNNKNIQLFFMEKPLFNTIDEYNKIAIELQQKIVINYLRRFNQQIQNLKKEIQTNQFLNLEKIIINYCKGLKNNGSHMIDLINFLFDNPKVLSSIILDKQLGFDDNDLTYDVFLKIEYQNKIIPLYFIGFNHEDYNIIEANIYFENQVIKYINSKNQIEYYDIVSHELFPTYKIMNKEPHIENLENRFMLEAYEYLTQILEKNQRNIASFEDEIKNIKFLKNILAQEL